MTKPPSGMLSLTYNLAYTPYYRELWLNGKYSDCFDAFGITDPHQQASIRDINEQLGATDTAQRNALIDQWMALVGSDVKNSAANPNILW